MSAHPILFSGPMVSALLAGTKTQTRRAMKPQPDLTPEVNDDGDAEFYIGDECVHIKPCPYGQPGDLLWVRETWAHYHTVNRALRSGGRSFSELSDGFAGYRADGHDTIEEFRDHIRLMSGCDLEAVEINGNRWRPSIHMPRWASRLTLRITDVRVQRLQDISKADAAAEGVEWKTCPTRQTEASFNAQQMARRMGMAAHYEAEILYVEGYRNLWNSINGHGSWDANPWVWAISFDVLRQNVDQVLRGDK